MKVHCYLLPTEISDAASKGKTAVVIDVLRASTSIVTAKANGAEKLIPTATIESAKKFLATLDRESTLLCGERGGRMIDGFDLGNSPRDYTRDAVSGKTVILTTSNGTETIMRLDGAREIIVCGLVNLGAVAETVRGEAELFIACSGRDHRFALEDAICAGGLVSRLRDLGVRTALDDGAATCEALFALHRADLAGALRGASHGRYLSEIGFDADIDDCAALDAYDVVPVVREGRIA
ncbi:MAG: 2-phosphosulfolactate phosphatase [bacterium]